MGEGIVVGGTLGAMVFGIVGGIFFGHIHIHAGHAAAVGLAVGGGLGAFAGWRLGRRR